MRLESVHALIRHKRNWSVVIGKYTNYKESTFEYRRSKHHFKIICDSNASRYETLSLIVLSTALYFTLHVLPKSKCHRFLDSLDFWIHCLYAKYYSSSTNYKLTLLQSSFQTSSFSYWRFCTTPGLLIKIHAELDIAHRSSSNDALYRCEELSFYYLD